MKEHQPHALIRESQTSTIEELQPQAPFQEIQTNRIEKLQTQVSNQENQNEFDLTNLEADSEKKRNQQQEFGRGETPYVLLVGHAKTLLAELLGNAEDPMPGPPSGNSGVNLHGKLLGGTTIKINSDMPKPRWEVGARWSSRMPKAWWWPRARSGQQTGPQSWQKQWTFVMVYSLVLARRLVFNDM